MYLRDIAIGWDEDVLQSHPPALLRQFGEASICIAELYRRFVTAKVATRETAKVVVTATDRLN